MSIAFLKITTLSLLGTVALAGGVAGGVYSYASVNSNHDIRQALEKRDFDAFKKAIISQSNTRAEGLTQDRFDKMSDNYAQSQSVSKAIEDNNYEEFKKVASKNMLKKVDSQAKFDRLVQFSQKRKEFVSKLQEVVKNNDFNGYKELIQEQKTEIRSNRTEAFGRRQPKELTEEQSKARFERLVEAFKRDGQLPNISSRVPGFGGKGLGNSRVMTQLVDIK